MVILEENLFILTEKVLSDKYKENKWNAKPEVVARTCMSCSVSRSVCRLQYMLSEIKRLHDARNSLVVMFQVPNNNNPADLKV